MTGREVGKEMTGRAFGGLFLALALSLALLPVPPAAGEMPAGPAADPHSHFRIPGNCSHCHVSAGAAPDPERFVPGADSFCLECHSPDGLGVTHPRAIRPADKAYGMKVPGDLRLDDEGRIFCLTCHNAHGPFLSPTRAYAAQKPANPGAPEGAKPAYRTYHARRSDPERGFVVLCEGCHGKQ
jgi:hypothetical protein